MTSVLLNGSTEPLASNVGRYRDYLALYLLPLCNITRQFKDISLNCFADDIHPSFSFYLNEIEKPTVLHSCLTAIKD